MGQGITYRRESSEGRFIKNKCTQTGVYMNSNSLANLQRGYQVTKEYSELTQACKRMAAARRANSPVQVERTAEVLQNITDYIEEQQARGKPLTHAGFMRCFGVGAETYYSLDKYDYVLEEYKALHDLPVDATTYTDDDGNVLPLVAWSNIKKMVCDVAIQEQLEENCYTNKGNPAGSIFGLKARYNWQEDNANTRVTNNTLVIADGEQARKSLQMLLDT